MEIERSIRELKPGEIDDIEWLRLRRSSNEPTATEKSLQSLARSMTDPLTPAPARGTVPNTNAPRAHAITLLSTGPTQDSTDWLSTIAVGQLQPILVLRYPRELHRFGKDYGLVFGYRRWCAAKRAGLPTIHARVIHLSADEYEDKRIRLWLRTMALKENLDREPLSESDEAVAARALKQDFEGLFPEAAKRWKHLTQQRQPGGQFSRTVKPRTGFTAALSHSTRRSVSTINRGLRIATSLSGKLLEHLYNKELSKSAALVLSRIPQDQQTEVLTELSARHQPFTVENIEAAITKRAGAATRHAKLTRRTNAPQDTSPPRTPTVTGCHLGATINGGPLECPGPKGCDVPCEQLTVLIHTIRLCGELTNRTPLSPHARAAAIPIVSDLNTATHLLLLRLQGGETTEPHSAATPGHRHALSPDNRDAG